MVMMPPQAGPRAGPSSDIQSLLAAIGGGGGGGPQPPPDQPDPYAQDAQGGAPDPHDALQQCIDDLHKLETVLPDPEDVGKVKQAGILLSQVNSKMYATKNQAQTAQQQFAQRLGA